MKPFINHINHFSENTAITYKGVEYSYSILVERIHTYTTLLDELLDKPCVVALVSEYSFEAIALFLALYEKNHIIVPITNSVQEEIEERLKSSFFDCKITFNSNEPIFKFSRNGELKHALISHLISENKSGLILFSSGSSGKPKTMIHNLDNLIASFDFKKPKKLNFLVFLMFDHVGGLNTLLNCLSIGASMTIPEKRDPTYICDLIEKYHVEILPTTPTFLNLMLISESFKNKQLDSLKMITYGTEPMPDALLTRLRNVFPKVKFLQTFGTSETGIAKLISKSSSSTYIKIDDPNIDFKVVEGELWLKSKTQILGYLNASMERFTEDGWFKTGDLVEKDNEGYLRVKGRKSEIINIGGQKVMPQEVEAILLLLSEVSDCLVYGESNIITGQIVVADIVAADNVNIYTLKSVIRQHCKERLDSYKNPIKINIVSKTEHSNRFKKVRFFST